MSSSYGAVVYWKTAAPVFLSHQSKVEQDYCQHAPTAESLSVIALLLKETVVKYLRLVSTPSPSAAKAVFVRRRTAVL